MSDIINSVKEEILRLADKQAAAQIGKAQQVASHYRSEAIELRRLVKQQEKEIKYLKKQVPVEQPEDAQLEGVRFSAKSVKSQRRRLGLSCEQYGSWLAFRRSRFRIGRPENPGLAGSNSSLWSPFVTSANGRRWRSWIGDPAGDLIFTGANGPVLWRFRNAMLPIRIWEDTMPLDVQYKIVELMDGDIPRYTAMCRTTQSFVDLAWRDRHIVDNPLMRWLRTLDKPPQEKVFLGSNVGLPRRTAATLLRFRRDSIAKMSGSWPDPPDFVLWQVHRGGRGCGGRSVVFGTALSSDGPRWRRRPSR